MAIMVDVAVPVIDVLVAEEPVEELVVDEAVRDLVVEEVQDLVVEEAVVPAPVIGAEVVTVAIPSSSMLQEKSQPSLLVLRYTASTWTGSKHVATSKSQLAQPSLPVLTKCLV